MGELIMIKGIIATIAVAAMCFSSGFFHGKYIGIRKGFQICEDVATDVIALIDGLEATRSDHGQEE